MEGGRRGGKEERNEFKKMGGRIANGEGEEKERVKGERREEVREACNRDEVIPTEVLPISGVP